MAVNHQAYVSAVRGLLSASSLFSAAAAGWEEWFDDAINYEDEKGGAKEILCKQEALHCQTRYFSQVAGFFWRCDPMVATMDKPKDAQDSRRGGETVLLTIHFLLDVHFDR